MHLEGPHAAFALSDQNLSEMEGSIAIRAACVREGNARPRDFAFMTSARGSNYRTVELISLDAASKAQKSITTLAEFKRTWTVLILKATQIPSDVGLPIGPEGELMEIANVHAPTNAAGLNWKFKMRNPELVPRDGGKYMDLEEILRRLHRRTMLSLGWNIQQSIRRADSARQVARVGRSSENFATAANRDHRQDRENTHSRSRPGPRILSEPARFPRSIQRANLREERESRIPERQILAGDEQRRIRPLSPRRHSGQREGQLSDRGICEPMQGDALECRHECGISTPRQGLDPHVAKAMQSTYSQPAATIGELIPMEVKTALDDDLAEKNRIVTATLNRFCGSTSETAAATADQPRRPPIFVSLLSPATPMHSPRPASPGSDSTEMNYDPAIDLGPTAPLSERASSPPKENQSTLPAQTVKHKDGTFTHHSESIRRIVTGLRARNLMQPGPKDCQHNEVQDEDCPQCSRVARQTCCACKAQTCSRLVWVDCACKAFSTQQCPGCSSIASTQGACICQSEQIQTGDGAELAGSSADHIAGSSETPGMPPAQVLPSSPNNDTANQLSMHSKGPTHIEPDGDGSCGTCTCRGCKMRVWPEDRGYCDLCSEDEGGECTCNCEGCEEDEEGEDTCMPCVPDDPSPSPSSEVRHLCVRFCPTNKEVTLVMPAGATLRDVRLGLEAHPDTPFASYTLGTCSVLHDDTDLVSCLHNFDGMSQITAVGDYSAGHEWTCVRCAWTNHCALPAAHHYVPSDPSKDPHPNWGGLAHVCKRCALTNRKIPWTSELPRSSTHVTIPAKCYPSATGECSRPPGPGPTAQARLGSLDASSLSSGQRILCVTFCPTNRIVTLTVPANVTLGDARLLLKDQAEIPFTSYRWQSATVESDGKVLLDNFPVRFLRFFDGRAQITAVGDYEEGHQWTCQQCTWVNYCALPTSCHYVCPPDDTSTVMVGGLAHVCRRCNLPDGETPYSQIPEPMDAASVRRADEELAKRSSVGNPKGASASSVGSNSEASASGISKCMCDRATSTKHPCTYAPNPANNGVCDECAWVARHTHAAIITAGKGRLVRNRCPCQMEGEEYHKLPLAEDHPEAFAPSTWGDKTSGLVPCRCCNSRCTMVASVKTGLCLQCSKHCTARPTDHVTDVLCALVKGVIPKSWGCPCPCGGCERPLKRQRPSSRETPAPHTLESLRG